MVSKKKQKKKMFFFLTFLNLEKGGYFRLGMRRVENPLEFHSRLGTLAISLLAVTSVVC